MPIRWRVEEGCLDDMRLQMSRANTSHLGLNIRHHEDVFRMFGVHGRAPRLGNLSEDMFNLRHLRTGRSSHCMGI
jgi:hypothetical protein